MTGKLILVGTPIGNLGDLSPRAEAALREADVIAAEDTRVTAKLLTRFSITTPVVSCHEHNERARAAELCDRIAAGETCALVTDAGMPAVSDPGTLVVEACAARGLPVEVVPGPSAAVAALALAGLPCARFSFEGFLPMQKKERAERLAELRGDTRCLVFYEAPHRLRKTLCDLRDAFGAERRAALARELTKLHEETLRLTLGEAAALYETREPRGEYVVVVEGAPARAQTAALPTPAEVRERLAEAQRGGLSKNDALRALAAETGASKNILYRLAEEAPTPDGRR